MDKADVVPVVLVGFGESPVAQRLEILLKRAGYPVVFLGEVGLVSSLLSQLPNATVVVYDEGGSAAAERTLSCAHEAHRRAAVVVVVPHAEFAQYYALMNQGAIGYFEAAEPTSVIFSGVRLASRQAHTV